MTPFVQIATQIYRFPLKKMSPGSTKHQLVRSQAARYFKEGLEESKSRPDVPLASLSTLARSRNVNGGL